jgi:RNA polymerase sigma-70 factor (ECF subfamily)
MIDASARSAWDLLADRLGTYIGRRLPADDAEDVRQEVLLRIFKGASRLNDEARFGPWVYTVARNAVVDRLRRKQPATTDLDEIDVAAPPGTEDEEVQPLLTCVTPFVARLPSPYREAITLTELQGLSQQEAADMEGVSLSGMKSRVQRGRRLLRTMFEECCHLTVDGRGRVIEADRRDEADSCNTPSSNGCGDCQ